MRVLIIGSGAREHCLAWKILQSSLIDKLYCAPGNAGTSFIAENVNIAATDTNNLLDFALKERIDLTVVGPEAPLAESIVDRFESKGLKIFGPKKELALLEASKVFTKEILKRYNIPTADFEIFENPNQAKEYVKKRGAPIVVKADGLASGKGVIVAKTVKEAQAAIDLIMVDKLFGSSGDRVIIEEALSGEEASILIFTDGQTIVPLVSAQDHKPVFDGDCGPNTGGMGAYSPAPLISDNLFKKVIAEVFNPLIRGLSASGKIYKGILYAGLMIREAKPYVLEFNVRFGDPETQAILPKLKSDLLEVMLKTIDGKLNQISLRWDERFCLCVVLASGGYPGSYQKGKAIEGLDRLINLEDVFVFHAGTRQAAKLVTNGGRVLNIVGLGDTIKAAQDKVYKAIESIRFENMHYRTDIGNKAYGYFTPPRRRI